MKNISILGSTGSIGCNALTIVDMFPQEFSVKALTAKSNIARLAKQIEQYKPDLAVVFDEAGARKLKELLPAGSTPTILHGEEGYREAATLNAVDMILAAMVGSAGLLPTLDAIESGKSVALANKETLVMAGEIVIQKAIEKGVQILPVDSEHSAIFQCLQGHRRDDFKKILLTASGGPFLKRPKEDFAAISVEDALNHPNWQMGRKITVDSATLMNKGLEVLEAKWLFDVSQDAIEVVVHPQSIIHSMVAYNDGSVIAQLGIPDMKGAIAYALSYPQRLPLSQPLPDFAGIGSFTFLSPEFDKFPCLDLAFEACRAGGTLPSVLNAANEIAVYAFLEKTLAFVDIPKVIAKTMEMHTVLSAPGLDDILSADQWARETAERIVQLKTL